MEIMHQETQRGVILYRSIDIDDVQFVIKRYMPIRCNTIPLENINWLSLMENILLRDEHHKVFWQILAVLTGQD